MNQWIDGNCSLSDKSIWIVKNSIDLQILFKWYLLNNVSIRFWFDRKLIPSYRLVFFFKYFLFKDTLYIYIYWKHLQLIFLIEGITTFRHPLISHQLKTIIFCFKYENVKNIENVIKSNGYLYIYRQIWIHINKSSTKKKDKKQGNVIRKKTNQENPNQPIKEMKRHEK